MKSIGLLVLLAVTLLLSAVTAVASLFVALGAVAGAFVDVVTRATSSRPRPVAVQPGVLPIPAVSVT
jgi:hypothetical protein